jgi:MFS family permease
MASVPVENASPLVEKISEIAVVQTTLSPAVVVKSNQKPAKHAIRQSLRLSTADGVLAGIFSLSTGGILLSNFLVELDATPVAFGMLNSIPMLVNLIQPLGAYLSERSTSRCHYSLIIYGPSRLLWLILVIGIAAFNCHWLNSQQLVILTLLIVFGSNLWGGLGGASWLSWMAVLVHRRLRGRYFGTRNSAISLTNLICVPLAGVVVSNWYGGSVQGYAAVLVGGILSGLASLACQCLKVDVNPQQQKILTFKKVPNTNAGQPIVIESGSGISCWKSILQETNFFIFVLYLGMWMFAVNLSAPFFNLYMLDTLSLDVSWVTVYSSLQAGANMFMLIVWGKLADRMGNRFLLLLVGILVAIAPLLWLDVSHNSLSLWLLLPLLHIFLGATTAAIDLCSNNMQLEMAPLKNQSIYFAIFAAIAGLSGAFGTIAGGFIVQNHFLGGLTGLFILSSIFRLVALLPLVFVQDARNQSFLQAFSGLLWLFGKK